MNRITSLTRVLALPVLAALLASGCALGRSVIDVKAPARSAVASGPAVKIVEVRDIRRFEVDPGDPSQPSLGDAAEIKDAKITERAIGRKRGGFGNALGDLALPD